MPAIGPNALVLVTGGSGFLGIHCVNELLERSHRVRTTVRSAEKGEYLKKLFKRHGDKLEYVIAEDLEKEGVFDEAVKGVEGVLHTASPFHFDAENAVLDKLVNPAVNGTNNVLNSIIKEKGIKRVVVTSSFAAVLDRNAKGHAQMEKHYTEADWNQSDADESAELGNKQSGMNGYRASKTLAEKAAWNFVEAHQPTWDLVTINPPFILGPFIQDVSDPEKLNTSIKAIWALSHGGKKEEELSNPGGSFVDVRNVAQAHVQALLRAEAGNQRFVVSSGKYTFQDIADVIHSTKLQLPADWKKNTPVGKTGNGPSVKQNFLDGSKAERVLSIKYYDIKDTIEGSLEAFIDYEKRNWKGIPSEDIVYLK